MFENIANENGYSFQLTAKGEALYSVLSNEHMCLYVWRTSLKSQTLS